MKRWLAVVLALSSAAAASLAQAAEPRRFKPTSKWAMEYADESCRLIRNFSDGAEEVTLALERFDPSTYFDVNLTGSGAKPSPGAYEVQLSFTPDGKTEERELFHSKLADGRAYYLLRSATIVPEVKWAMWTPAELRDYFAKPLARADEVAAAGKVDAMLLSHGLGPPMTLELGSMAAPIAAMQNCVDELVTHWGVDAQVHRTLKRRPAPTNAGKWPVGIIYPTRAIYARRGGYFHYRVMIDAAGKPTACTLGKSNDDSDFAHSVCEPLMHVNFVPALDAAGKPVSSFYAGAIAFHP